MRLEQSQLMAKAMTEARKPHELIVLTGEGNELARSESRARVLGALEAFLARNLPLDPAAQAAPATVAARR